MTILIREARADDASEMVLHVKRVLNTSGYTLTKADEFQATEESQRTWIKDTLDNGHLILVAEHEGGIIGNLIFFRGTKARNSHTGELALGIDEAWRGQGIGKQLIERLIQWAEIQSGIEKIWLQVISGNDQAVGLYKKLGFKEEGALTKQIKFSDGRYADLISMSLFIRKA